MLNNIKGSDKPNSKSQKELDDEESIKLIPLQFETN